MKRFAVIAFAVLIAGKISLKTAPQNPQPQSPPGTIMGKVIREGTSEPISGVQIFMNTAAGSAAPGAAQIVTPVAPAGAVVMVNGAPATVVAPGGSAVPNPPAAITDGSGSFIIRDVPAGRQVITASKDGYFGPSRTSIQTNVQENVTVVSSKNAEVTFTMIPGGVIAGRVTNSSGEGAPDIQIQALRVTYQDANPVLQAISSRTTDDRGDYRLFKLPPGQYYVVAAQAGILGVGGGVRGGAGGPPPPPPSMAIPNATVRTFYPDATETVQSVSMNIKGGDEISGVNVRVQPVSSARKVSGQVMTTISLEDMGPSARTRGAQEATAANPPAPRTGGVVVVDPLGVVQGAASPNTTLTLYPHDKGGPQDLVAGISVSASLGEPQNGRFEIPNVPRETYDLYASVPDLKGYGPQQPPGLAATPLAYGRTTIDVGDRDLDGIRITVHHGTDVKGHITVDGKPSPAASNLKITMQPGDSASRVPIYQQVGRTQAVVDADGSFLIPAVPEALFRFQVSFGAPANTPAGATLNANAYVADILEGGSSVFDSGITISDRPLGLIDVLVKSDGGGIEGVVRGTDKLAPGGANVVLVPSPTHRSNPVLYKTTTADPMGRFSFRGIAPGEYKIFAWTAVPGTAYRNADYMKKYENRGQPVNVIAGARLNVSVDLISEDGL